MQVEIIQLKNGRKKRKKESLALVMHQVIHIHLPTKQITIAKIKTFLIFPSRSFWKQCTILRGLLRDTVSPELPFPGILQNVEYFALVCYEIALNSLHPSLPGLYLFIETKRSVWVIHPSCAFQYNPHRIYLVP